MTFNRDTGALNGGLITESVFNLVRGFAGWLALSPMIYAWGLMVFILFIITFVNFQDESVEILSFIGKTVSGLVEKYPYLEHLAIAEPSANKYGGIDLGGDAFRNFIFRLYTILTIPLVILGTTIDMIRGSTLPRPMHIKLKFLSLMTLISIAVLFANYSLGSTSYHGSSIVWGVMFIAGPGIVFVISFCSLFLSHIIGSIGYKHPGDR